MGSCSRRAGPRPGRRSARLRRCAAQAPPYSRGLLQGEAIMRLLLGAAMAATLVAGPALGQGSGDASGAAAAAVEAIGGELARAGVASDSVFVYAHGKVLLAGSTTEELALTAQVARRSPTAAEAVRLRDAAVEAIRSAAVRYGVRWELASSAVSLGPQPIRFGAQAIPMPPPMVAPRPGAAPGAASAPPAPPQFEAQATVRLGLPAGPRQGAFLDEVHAAGADSISQQTTGSFNPLAGVLGSAASDVDPKIWDEASRKAIDAARADASVLAAAAGRRLGEARQVYLLSRSAQNGQADVVVAVRFALGSGTP
jgi:hypothetical protein